MSYYTFDETNFNTFNPDNLIFEEGKKDIGTFKVSYFNIKYKNNDGSPCMIKVKTPSLTTPFGANKNQFGKLNITVNIPHGPLHDFLNTLQDSIKKYICDNIKTFNKASSKAKITTNEFDILNTSFGIIKPHNENTNYDDTIVFDITSEFDQKNMKVFNNNKELIEGIMPGLPVLGIFGIVYWMLKKKMSPLLIMLIMLIVSIAGAYFGFLG